MKLKDLAARLGAATREMIEAALQPVHAKMATLEEGIRSIPSGPRGERGERGEDGARGKDGRDGSDGMHGEKGKDGRDGIDGKDGRDGVDGKDGAPGKDGSRGEKGERGEPGRDGRDASDLKVIEKMIAEQLGLQLAAMLEGMKFHSPDEGRTLIVEMLTARREVRTALVLDRGVYRPEQKYLKGDSVTWAGSGWIAQIDEPTDKPGVSDQWRLAVKRGRDGKDAK